MQIASASLTRWARLAPRRRRVTWEETKGSSGQWVLASETRYVYDGMRVIQERTSNGVPTVAYTRGPDLSGTLEGAGGIGGLLARSEWNSVSSTWSHAFYHSDGVGNVTALAVPSGGGIALAGSYRYDPFGRLIGTPTDLAARNTQRFSSKEWHNPIGFYYFGYRFYDPATQRWLNRDPIGEDGGVNLYGYVENDPLSNVDFFGLWSPGAHDDLINHALAGKASDDCIARIQRSSRGFDKRTQGVQYTHVHSMRRKEQSSADAIAERDGFIQDTLAKARTAAESGNCDAAMDALGEALHPIMDSTSPMHTDNNGNPNVWNPYYPFGHSPNDKIGNETISEITGEIYQKMDKRLTEAFNKVKCKCCQ